MTRAAAAVAAIALGAAVAAGCGGGEGDDLLTEEGIQGCLTAAGYRVEPPAAASSPALGSVSPDFRAVDPGGVGAEVVVQGSDEKARRSAADIRGALTGFGAQGSEGVAGGNAILVFEDSPTEESRSAAEGCLSR